VAAVLAPCPSCRRPIAVTALACPSCGAPTPTAARQERSATTQRVVAVLVLAVLLVGGWQLYVQVEAKEEGERQAECTVDGVLRGLEGVPLDLWVKDCVEAKR
jgi:hypothetical protein